MLELFAKAAPMARSLVLLGLAIQGAGRAQTPGKAPLPDEAARTAARQLVQQVYAEDLRRAADAPSKAAVARKLLSQAAETRHDLAGRYVLLETTVELAEAADDLELSLEAISRIRNNFDTDALVLEAAVLTRTAERRTRTAPARVMEQALIVADRAARCTRFDIVDRMLALLAAMKPKAADAGSLDSIAGEITQTAEAIRSADAAQRGAAAALGRDPSDAAANAAVGAHQCFVLADWASGLPLLAKAADPTLAELARRDLSAPTVPLDGAKLGHDWWTLATERSALPAANLRRRAAYWYARAVTDLDGLHAEIAKKRIAAYRAELEARCEKIKRLVAAGQARLAGYLLEQLAAEDDVLAAAEIAALRTTIAEAGRRSRSFDTVPSLFEHRLHGREKLRSERIARAIELGLDWLRAHQEPPLAKNPGMWDCDGFMKRDVRGPKCDGIGNPVHDVGVSSLALLAFLADAAPFRPGPDAAVVERGLSWLRGQQDAKSGLVGVNASHDFVYDHAIAALALCEAYALLGDDELRVAAQGSLDYLERHRNPNMVWRYQPRDHDNDTSITTWCTTANAMGRAAGLTVNPDADKRALEWYDQVTDPLTGEAGYSRRGEPSSRHPGDHAARFPPEKGAALTAAALHARYLLGQDPRDTVVMLRAVQAIDAKRPLWSGDGSIDFYYWYHGALALHAIGEGEAWIAALHNTLIANQRQDGNFAGSWDAVGVWDEDGGRVYSTALAILCLQVHYRYGRLDPLAFIPKTPQFARLRRAWERGQYDQVAKLLDSLATRAEASIEDGDHVAVIRQALDRQATRALDEVAAAAKSVDYLTARQRLQEIEQAFGGLPAGVAAKAELERLARDKAIAKEIRALERLEAVLEAYPRTGRDRCVRGLRDIIKRCPGTRAAELAQVKLQELGERG